MRSADEAYGRGDATRLLELVDPDRSGPISIPASKIRSRRSAAAGTQLAWALGRQADRGVIGAGGDRLLRDKVMVAVHTPGADQHRAWQGHDRNYLVLTLRQGQVVAMRAFRNLDGARRFTSEGG